MLRRAWQIADFGCAKLSPLAFEPPAAGGGAAAAAAVPDQQRDTCQVVYLQFRAPELLCGASHHGGGVDVWAAASIIAEMTLRPRHRASPSEFFTSDQCDGCEHSDARQLGRILDGLGVPEDRYQQALADMGTVPGIASALIPEPSPSRLPAFFGEAAAGTLELLSAMFSFSPRERLTAQQALAQPYFVDAEPRALSRTSLAVSRHDVAAI